MNPRAPSDGWFEWYHRKCFRAVRAGLLVIIMALVSLPRVHAYQVLVDLNTYLKYDSNSVRDVQQLKCDGVWAIPQNDAGTFTPEEWGTMLAKLGPWIVSEDNPGGHQAYDQITAAAGRAPDDAFCYNETGGEPGTTLTRKQIVEQSATHGGTVVVLTRAGGGKWMTQMDQAFKNPHVTGACLESEDPAVGNAPGFIDDCLAHGKRAYVILIGGNGTAWIRSQIQNMLAVVPESMASRDVFIVISDYRPDVSCAKWFGTTNCVQSDIALAELMAAPTRSGARGGTLQDRAVVAADRGVVTIAQISDTHLGESHSPQAADNLRQVVKMVNASRPDAVILSGDIGENQPEREQVKRILKELAAPVYYVPGNHEFHDLKGLEQYREQFGPDYYRFQVKNVEVLALDTQLTGNYEKFEAKTSAPLSTGLEVESEKMFNWLAQQAKPTRGKVVIAVQHIPLFRDNGFPDAKPYWTVNAPYAGRETELLRALGVKHVLAGHWHTGRVFEQGGITIHVAPATSWLPFGGKLGFALHSIDTNGEVHTAFVPLPGPAGHGR